GLGVASIRDLATSLPINVVAVPPEEVETVGSPYVAATIPAGTYERQTADVAAAAGGHSTVTEREVEAGTAYQRTELLVDHLDQLVAAHPAAKGIVVEKALEGMPIPLHPGAERYYREKGLLQ